MKGKFLLGKNLHTGWNLDICYNPNKTKGRPLSRFVTFSFFLILLRCYYLIHKEEGLYNIDWLENFKK